MPDVLLLHGFGSDRLSWMLNQSEIAPGARVLAPDLPAHGANAGVDVGDGSVAVLAGLVAADLDDTPKHIVGHSLGGAVALELARSHPGRVASLTLIAPAGLGQALNSDFLDRFPHLSDPAEAEALLHRLVSRPRLINKHMVARVLDHLALPGVRDSLGRIARGLQTLDPGDALHAALAVPRLIIWGGVDQINPADATKLQALGGEQHILETAGHMPHVENAREVNGWIAAFLAAAA